MASAIFSSMPRSSFLADDGAVIALDEPAIVLAEASDLGGSGSLIISQPRPSSRVLTPLSWRKISSSVTQLHRRLGARPYFMCSTRSIGSSSCSSCIARSSAASFEERSPAPPRAERT